MEISNLTSEEKQFVCSLLSEYQQNAQNESQLDLVSELMLKFVFDGDINRQEVGFLQYILQEQSEIHGRRSTIANEKSSPHLSGFIPTRTLQLIKSVSDKLGANLFVDTITKSDQNLPRAEGSRSIMTDPVLNK